MNTKPEKPDVILLCEMPGGKTAAGIAFHGTDVAKAVEFAAEPVFFPVEHIRKMADYYQRVEGYESWRNIRDGWNAVICVKKGFERALGEQIAKTFMAEVMKRMMQ